MKPTEASCSELDSSAEESRRQRAVTLSVWEGAFAMVMFTITDTFAVPAAVSLASPALAVAVLASLPLCLGSLGQLALTWFSSPTRARRPKVALSAASQALFLGLCAVSGFATRTRAPWLFVGAFVAFNTANNLVNGAWISWMRDLVPAHVKGRVFAARNRVLGLVQLGCALAVGLFARRYTASSTPWHFFLVIFCVAALARAASASLLSRQYEPARRSEPVSLRPGAPRPRFLRFCLSGAILQGAAVLSGPFFNVWYLTELHFDYSTFVACTAAILLGGFVFLPLWGKLADLTGSFRLMQVSAALVAVIPLPYLFCEHPRAILLLNFYCGAVWSAYNLTNFNTLLDSVRGRHADREIALAMAVTGVAVALLGLLGGVLATHLPPLAGSRYRALFLCSALIRLAVFFFGFCALRPPQPLPETAWLELAALVPGYRAGSGVWQRTLRLLRRPLSR